MFGIMIAGISCDLCWQGGYIMENENIIDEKTIEKARTEISEIVSLLSDENVIWLRSFLGEYFFEKEV